MGLESYLHWGSSAQKHQQQQHYTVLALATLGNMAQIEMILSVLHSKGSQGKYIVLPVAVTITDVF